MPKLAVKLRGRSAALIPAAAVLLEEECHA
jgi:hypothetical protein